MQITAFQPDHIPAAAALFIDNLKQQRTILPILPDRLENPQTVAEKLGGFIQYGPAFAALDGGKLVGYLGAYLVEGFRDTDRKAAYCPEWGYGTIRSGSPAITQALYRAAAAEWTRAGCHTHAITLLAHDHAAEKVWFWNGFGLAVVDAVRPFTPLEGVRADGYTVRKATSADVETLAILDAEHIDHYTQPPTLMTPRTLTDVAAFAELLTNPHHSVWLAEQDGAPMGFMRFEGSSFGAADVINAETTTTITGAYVRPAYRGRRAAVALLDGALRDYAARGFACCAVNFESFNPEAADFWMKYFTPACYSLMRVPESLRLPG
ncbi:MAG: GNAT family N-acetyltransferase [Chloroflexi bacterium]|nr:GNAT family N-acetyltransferase [Chloroflexota bacterium]